MTQFRFIPLVIALSVASSLVACNTVPAMPMGTANAGTMGASEQMAKMDGQMKTMQAMHEKMMAAKTPEERNAMMSAHMKSMKDGMAMMKGMSGMSGDMGSRPQTMEKRMEMMQSMMEMMMDRMPSAAGK